MGNLVKQLENYLKNATPEQLAHDEEILKEWENVGPTVDEYFEMLEKDKKIRGEIN